jgi:hypothetical protein
MKGGGYRRQKPAREKRKYADVLTTFNTTRMENLFQDTLLGDINTELPLVQ